MGIGWREPSGWGCTAPSKVAARVHVPVPRDQPTPAPEIAAVWSGPGAPTQHAQRTLGPGLAAEPQAQPRPGRDWTLRPRTASCRLWTPARGPGSGLRGWARACRGCVFGRETRCSPLFSLLPPPPTPLLPVWPWQLFPPLSHPTTVQGRSWSQGSPNSFRDSQVVWSNPNIHSWAPAATDNRGRGVRPWELGAGVCAGVGPGGRELPECFLLVCGSPEPRDLLMWGADLLPSPQDSA